MPNPIVHFEIEASDVDRAKKFYSEAFDWKMDQMGEDMGGYVVIETTTPNTPGAINGGMFKGSGTKNLNAYSCVISVEDIDKAIEAVKTAGGEVLNEKDDIPGVGIYAKCKDTEGNNFSLLQPSSEMAEKS